MTFKQLMELAMDELHRPLDAMTSADYQQRMMRFANEAIIDITGSFRPWRRDTLLVTSDKIALNQLPYKCQKVLSVDYNGERYPFYYGYNTDELIVKSIPDGEVNVTYRYIPPKLKSMTDVPQLPEFLHSLIVTYMVARERIQLDSVAQSGAKVNLSLYETLKRRYKISMDEPDSCNIYNQY
ncbi:MAG: hypothetical protein PHT58_04780 [Eubacteriales bacterium]|nr:hypothetical protein [Eubacteriales bacterium]